MLGLRSQLQGSGDYLLGEFAGEPAVCDALLERVQDSAMLLRRGLNEQRCPGVECLLLGFQVQAGFHAVLGGDCGSLAVGLWRFSFRGRRVLPLVTAAVFALLRLLPAQPAAAEFRLTLDYVLIRPALGAGRVRLARRTLFGRSVVIGGGVSVVVGLRRNAE